MVNCKPPHRHGRFQNGYRHTVLNGEIQRRRCFLHAIIGRTIFIRVVGLHWYISKPCISFDIVQGFFTKFLFFLNLWCFFTDFKSLFYKRTSKTYSLVTRLKTDTFSFVLYPQTKSYLLSKFHFLLIWKGDL